MSGRREQAHTGQHERSRSTAATTCGAGPQRSPRPRGRAAPPHPASLATPSFASCRRQALRGRCCRLRRRCRRCRWPPRRCRCPRCHPPHSCRCCCRPRRCRCRCRCRCLPRCLGHRWLPRRPLLPRPCLRAADAAVPPRVARAAPAMRRARPGPPGVERRCGSPAGRRGCPLVGFARFGQTCLRQGAGGPVAKRCRRQAGPWKAHAGVGVGLDHSRANWAPALGRPEGGRLPRRGQNSTPRNRHPRRPRRANQRPSLHAPSTAAHLVIVLATRSPPRQGAPSTSNPRLTGAGRLENQASSAALGSCTYT
jgi:hypothetical protein